MDLDLPYINAHFPDFLPTETGLEGGATAYRLRLPDFQGGRNFGWAELRLPRGFPESSKAAIYLSPDAVLRVPHVERSGLLCLTMGDPGPGSDCSPEDRVLILLHDYHEKFLRPWLSGELDKDFEAEAQNYWEIELVRKRANTDPVVGVWTLDQCSAVAVVRRGLLLTPSRIIIAADEELQITNRLIQSMGARAQQRIGVLIADIPISQALTPATWPRDMTELDRVLAGRLEPAEYQRFQYHRGRRGRRAHRVVLLRNSEAAFAYLLPGGPPTVSDLGKQKKAIPPLLKPLPLKVTRLDPNWTVGRDQHPEVPARQCKRVLVIGAGALGSPIIDLLAKAGVGSISVVDAQSVSSANIGRHLLGAESIDLKKVTAIAQRVNNSYPATLVEPYEMTAEEWFRKNTLSDIDTVLDLTGDPDVRFQVERARKKHPRSLLIGWMEPYVAAAHVCLLPAGTAWFQCGKDLLKDLQAVDWPDKVIQREPGCSSRFQSYTATAATHAVALVAEQALELIDRDAQHTQPQVVSWVRGQNYLDRHWPGLVLKEWALVAAPYDGMILSRPFQ